jgi:hypothetical protein
MFADGRTIVELKTATDAFDPFTSPPGMCATETAGQPRPGIELSTFCDQEVRDRFGDLAQCIREFRLWLQSGAGRLVKQMLRQRCDTGPQRFLFVA